MNAENRFADHMKKLFLFSLLAFLLFSAAPGVAPLELTARRRAESPPGSGKFQVADERETWDPRQTAVIICDMWDRHWCPSATARVAELAPAINNFVMAAREKGLLIVHAPSGTMGFYRGQPARMNAVRAPLAPNLPLGMAVGRGRLDEREKAAAWPVDDSDGGCDVEVAKAMVGKQVWTREIASIEIKHEDAISDSGWEIWDLFEQRGIKNVILVGVHTNMCVVGRPFGLRNLVHYGKNALLIRDLTDSMYNPKMPPQVDHFTGTDLVIAHIETYICPSILSTAITGQPSFRFRPDTRSRPGLD